MSEFLLLSCFSGDEILTRFIATFLLVIVVIFILLFLIVVIFILEEPLEVVYDELLLCFGEHLGHLKKDKSDS